MSSQIYSFIVILFCFNCVLSQSVGDPCSQNGISGRCVLLRNCLAARNPATRRTVKRCGFQGREPIICCLDSAVKPATPAYIQSTTTEYVPPLNDYSEIRSGTSTGQCAPIPEKDTAKKTGRKAFDKCLEYQEQLLYPCERGVDFLGKFSRGNYCSHKVDELIVGGQEAKRDEFPHMALLSFDEIENPTDPICGGTVISDRFILTAGHCTYKAGLSLSTAKVGLLHRTEDVSASNTYKIQRIIKHPEYKPPSTYNDIALLETDRPMKLSSTLIPACLDIGEGPDEPRASVTGWGNTEYLGNKADVLLKVALTKFTDSECSRRYKPGMRNMQRGYDRSTQLCFGHHTESKDACQGDSGGPLQVHNRRIHCMYTVVGVTSFGNGCGKIGFPGMYTRVAAYTAWIESVVWP